MKVSLGAGAIGPTSASTSKGAAKARSARKVFVENILFFLSSGRKKGSGNLRKLSEGKPTVYMYRVFKFLF